MLLKTSQIRVDGGTQPRAQLVKETVDEYRDALRNHDSADGSNWPFPALDVFYDGHDYWLADGFHRLDAARKHGRFEVPAEVRQGTQRDAVLFAAGANAEHGLKRTAEDKRRAVLRLLEDEEWGGWSDREIARRCKVSPSFVGGVRVTVHVDSEGEERTYTTKHGNQSTMNVAKIGRDKAPSWRVYPGEQSPTIRNKLQLYAESITGGYARIIRSLAVKDSDGYEYWMNRAIHELGTKAPFIHHAAMSIYNSMPPQEIIVSEEEPERYVALNKKDAATSSPSSFLPHAIATEAAEIAVMFPEKDEVLDLLKRAESALCLAVAKYDAAKRPSFSQANRVYHSLLTTIESYKKESG